MDAAGIIAEFDPFHNGHKYLLDTVHAELPSHALVCVMSGNFVQRGTPAVCSKWTRAEMAVRCGADLVLELPFVYACNSAPEFAKGGVKVLKAAGCDTIAFGSESGDAERLAHTSELACREPEEFKAALQNSMSEGRSYAASYSRALEELDPATAGLKDTPNDLLAVEYLKQNILQNAGLKPLAVQRKGEGHGSAEGISSGFASASALREEIRLGNMKDVIVNQPDAIHELSLAARYLDKAAKYRLFELIRYSLVVSTPEHLSEIYGMAEGLENAFMKASLIAPNTNDLIMAVKTRRYTYARLSRILMAVITGLTAAEYRKIDSEPLPYLRPLAFNEKGAALLRQIKDRGTAVIVSNVNKYTPDTEVSELMLGKDLLASDIYSLIQGITIYEGSDKTRSPLYIAET